MRVNTFHVVPQHATFLFIFLLHCEKRHCTVYCKSTEKCPSIYIQSLALVFPQFLLESDIFNNLFSIYEYSDIQIFFQKITSFPAWSLFERKLRLPEHPTHMRKMVEKPIGCPIYSIASFAGVVTSS